MTDGELAALAAGVKTMLDARDLTARSELAAMRTELQDLRAEVETLRATVKVLPSEVHASAVNMVQTLGASLGNTLPDAVRAAAERHFMKMAIQRGMATEGTAS